MHDDLETILWHIRRLMERAGITSDEAHAEIRAAFEGLDTTIKRLEEAMHTHDRPHLPED